MKKLSITLVLMIAAVAAIAGGKVSKNNDLDRPVHEIHSMMIYNFVKYIQWPDNSSEFVIGVVGDDEVYNTLKAWYDGKIRGNKKFIIKKFNSPADITSAHIVYVAKGASGSFDKIKNSVNTSTLLITDQSGLGQKGSGINFKVVNGKLAFELNQAVIDNSNLKVSSQLTAMAILI